jgi:predicted component of type VI protein secretion system
MYSDVRTVKPLSDYRIYVELVDGRKGVFDVKPYLDHGVFR